MIKFKVLPMQEPDLVSLLLLLLIIIIYTVIICYLLIF